MNSMEIVGWFYNEGFHCCDCAYDQGMNDERMEDELGANPSPVPYKDIDGMGEYCDDCGKQLSELSE